MIISVLSKSLIEEDDDRLDLSTVIVCWTNKPSLYYIQDNGTIFINDTMPYHGCKRLGYKVTRNQWCFIFSVRQNRGQSQEILGPIWTFGIDFSIPEKLVCIIYQKEFYDI